MKKSLFTEKIIKREELGKILNERDKTVVFTNGCFDILHSGHINYLYQAAQLGDILIIGINSDSSVKKLKGDSRPINSGRERAEIMAALEFTDYIIIFDEENPEKTLEILKPDIHVKGGDYIIEDIPERKIVESYGGKVIILNNYPGYSTSSTIEKIIKIHKQEN